MTEAVSPPRKRATFISGRTFSARSYLLAWIIIPLSLLIAADTYFLHLNALRSANIAYDRTLLATAHAVGDSVRFEQGEYRISLPLALFEIYETDHSGRYFYRVSTIGGKLLSGDEELPPYQGNFPAHSTYPSVVQFYEDTMRGQAIRVAALHQPVFSNDESGSILIQVAEPMRIRQDSARAILHQTLYRQSILLLVASLVVYMAVTRALRPLNQLSLELNRRSTDDLLPLPIRTNLSELRTVTEALNQLMEQVARLINHQKRFIANASHQLRTPLAVLKAQLQSGLHGDAPTMEVLGEMSETVERTISLANHMLLLAKIEQSRMHAMNERCPLSVLARDAVLELSPLIAQKNLDFEINEDAAEISGNAWLVGELIRNLLINAIQHTPVGCKLGIHIESCEDNTRLLIWNEGEGLPTGVSEQLFEPFATSFSTQGTGLGLAISKEITDTLGGQITLSNRSIEGRTVGLDALLVFRSR